MLEEEPGGKPASLLRWTVQCRSPSEPGGRCVAQYTRTLQVTHTGSSPPSLSTHGRSNALAAINSVRSVRNPGGSSGRRGWVRRHNEPGPRGVQRHRAQVVVPCELEAPLVGECLGCAVNDSDAPDGAAAGDAGGQETRRNVLEGE